ncbi:MAG: adenylate/guanylate cyclase domain-containing protein [Bacteroidales bacterium]|jgi:class 3 adenylate cyclase|nr:adenylate/guanylate cyclase domain-containing protein [Bacteroidales bacterium]
MGLGDDLKKDVQSIFSEQWSERNGQKVPSSEDVRLGNDAVKLDGTVLYADLDASTNLVDMYAPAFAAEIYKSYLHCTAKIIKSEGGIITSYDGDRIMAVFIGDSKNTSAVRTAMKINYSVTEIINPALKNQYEKTDYTIKQVVGIDTSPLFIARTGVRGSNDLVWVGRSANYAAKLTSLSAEYSSWITEDVYDNLNKSIKISKDGRLMWEKASWTTMNDMTIYRSNWWWSL